MPVDSQSCPDDDSIHLFVEGLLEPSARTQIEHHLDGCESCRREVSALAELLAAESPRAVGEDPEPEANAPLSSTPSSSPEPIAGESLGTYAIERVLGRGGMGVVLLARDRELDREVALKVLHEPAEGPSADDESRLWTEAQALARLTHPNVVTVHGVERVGERLLIVMEYVVGQPLDAWWTRPRTPNELVGVLDGAARGLHAAHERGLVHRDIKPSNLIVGDDGRTRVVDFGLAWDLQPREGKGRASVAGTPAFMAPEQRQGATPDPRSDQFSLCLTLVEGLYGRQLRRSVADARSPFSLPRRSSHGHPVPAVLRRVLQRGLQPEPAARFESMEALLDALGRMQAQRRLRWVAVGALCTVAVGGLTWWAQPDALTCPTPDSALAGIGDDPTRDAVERRFGSPSVGQKLEEAAAEWHRSHDRACAQPEPSVAVARCLAQRRLELSAAVQLMLTPSVELDATTAELLLDHRRSAVSCLDPAGTSQEALPDARDVRRALARLTIEGQRAQALAVQWRYDEARRIVEPARAEAESLQFAPLTTELMMVEGLSQPMQRTMLEEAAHAAAAAGEPRLRAGTAIAWAAELSLARAEPSNAEIWLRQAESSLDSLADPAPLDGVLAFVQGLHLLRWGQLVAAEPYIDRALALYERSYGPSSLLTAIHVLNVRAVLLHAQGRIAAALESRERELEIIEARVGADSPLLVVPLVGQARGHLAAGRPEAADKAAARAHALVEEHAAIVPPSMWLETHLLLAEGLVAEGRADEAVELLAHAVEPASTAAPLRIADAAAMLARLPVSAGLRPRVSELLDAVIEQFEHAHPLGRLVAEPSYRRLLDLRAEFDGPAPIRAIPSTDVVRGIEPFTGQSLSGVEVCAGSECQRGDRWGIVSLELGADAGVDPPSGLRLRHEDRVPLSLFARPVPGPQLYVLPMPRQSDVGVLAGWLGLQLDPRHGMVLTGVRDDSQGSVSGAALTLHGASGRGPFYLGEHGAFYSERPATTDVSIAGVLWVDVPPGAVQLAADHPSRACRPGDDAWPGSEPALAWAEVVAGELSVVPDFVCVP